MTKAFCLIASLALTLHVFSQRTAPPSLIVTSPSTLRVSPNILASPYQGEQFKGNTDQDVEGTPLLFDDWKTGEVTLANGELYALQKINFDASGSRFIYSHNDTIFEFQSDLRQVKLYADNSESNNGSALVFRNDLLPGQSGFVEVLTSGKITILRKFSKKPEGENYSNGIVNNTRKYVLHTEDVALVGNKVVPFKYGSSDLEQLTSDKRDEVNSYIKSNKLKPKKEDDFLKSVNFYNSIN